MVDGLFELMQRAMLTTEGIFHSHVHMRKVTFSNALAAFAAVCAALIALPSSAADSRSFKAEVLFRLQNPCPSTGETRGDCKGYVIDRIIPALCGGAEEPANLQWQTLAQAKEKDRWERIGCRPGRKLGLPPPPVDAEVFPMQDAPETPEVKPLPLG
jgi:hypothetical protein